MTMNSNKISRDITNEFHDSPRHHLLAASGDNGVTAAGVRNREAAEPPGPGQVGSVARLLGPVGAGAAVAVALGVYGRVHPPAPGALPTLGLPSVLAAKTWIATVALLLAIGQIVSALWLYGRLPLRWRPRGLAAVHRWSGTAAFLVSLPVAYHCLWSLGLRSDSARALVHGLVGCAFYGAFATKLLALRADGAPRWAIPVIGSMMVTLLTGVWLTSALWFLTTFGPTG
jgi:hypothetical protein